MARVAVIGEPLRIHGYGLPDAILCPATDQAEAVLAWRDLPDDIDVAVLTPSAARWLASEIAGRPGVLPVLLAEVPLTQPPIAPDGQPEGGVRPATVGARLPGEPGSPAARRPGGPGHQWSPHRGPARELWIRSVGAKEANCRPKCVKLIQCPEDQDLAVRGRVSCGAEGLVRAGGSRAGKGLRSGRYAGRYVCTCALRGQWPSEDRCLRRRGRCRRSGDV